VDFYAVLDQVVELLRSRGRVSYRALKEHFGLNDERLDAIRAELLYAHSENVSADGQGLVWTVAHHGERRQLTMFFCDLVGSTTLASQFDPEDWREIVGSYYDACAKVIARFDGHIAQYLGDGLLVYFGYPRAHEDDAQRAVRAGLGIIGAVGQLNAVLSERHGISLAVRLGCHTGLVVVGDDVGGTGLDDMVLGDTPNIAARLEGIAAPNTLVIGPLTYQLVHGFFNCRPIGTPTLKGVASPLAVYQVLNESNARTRLEAAGNVGLTPLVGRSDEVRLLEQRWAQVVDGRGHVVLITGEAGIGKSRLVHSLTEHIAQQRAWLTPCQGSPYHRDTALYPFIDLFERVVLRFERPESASDKLSKLETFFVQSGLPLADALPHLCSLLSIPLPDGQEISELPPDQRKQQTMLALESILLRRAKQQPVLLIVEDLHWVDPTTIEFLTLLTEQIHDARILALFTCRPEFDSPWTDAPNVTEVNVTRLMPTEAAELINRVAGDKTLPNEIVADVVAKTDGVPLFIEELTKTLLESDLLTEKVDRYELAGPLPPLAIPNTLHDSLMARLDRLSAIKGLAQLGAAIGREFSFALLRAVSPWSEEILLQGLAQLVAAEFLYQQGTPPQATYRFKHALIQDTAYQSLLKSTRQQHHQRIATTMESEFPETVETQPELLAHHYTEAGLLAQAVPYWLAAATRALQRYANQEAANYANRGLELLATLPDTPQRDIGELSLQRILAPALSFMIGPHSVEHIHARAYELARNVGDTSAMFPALSGLAYGKILRGEMCAARTFAQEFLELAEPHQDALVLAAGHWMLAYVAWWQGDVVEVHTHSRKGLAFYNPDQHRAGVAAYNQNPGVVCGYLNALADWVLGYPTQASEAMKRTVAHARELEHPYSVGITLLFSAQLAQLRREPELAKAKAEEALAVSIENGAHALALWCLLPRGWALVQQGDVGAGIVDIRESMDRRRAFRMGAVWPWYLALVADAYGASGEFQEGFHALDEAMQWVQRNDERLYLAEVHRIRGELLLRQATPDPAEAEGCFEQALAVARDQQAKSWELRAATSMARLWRETGRRDGARALLEPVYDWFTEGFDTADLKDAKALLEQLS
jgi:class 3 adenylate cyclase/predicted ATPase